MVYKLLSAALAILWSAQAVSCSYVNPPCTNPAIRREWRAITTKERAEWIRAINVRIKHDPTLIILLTRIGIQCLSQQPHDLALTPSVDPSVSLIPPVNASSSYYDGRIQSIDFTVLGVGVFNCLLHRYNVPPHGPEYSGT